MSELRMKRRDLDPFTKIQAAAPEREAERQPSYHDVAG
jgi:hypothetical protein